MAGCDNQEILSVKKIPLRDLPNENQNVIIQSPQNSTMQKDSGNILESPKLSGIKRYRSDVSPNHILHQSSGADAISGRVSHVRRKLEPEASKFCLGIYARNNDHLKEKDLGVDKAPVFPSVGAKDPTPMKNPFIGMDATSSDKQEQNQDQIHGHGYGTKNVVGAPFSLPHQGFLGSVSSSKQQTSLTPTEKDELDTTASVIPSSRKENKLSWKDRFVQLQAYLKECDESSKDGYIQMLRSLSAAGRSKYAVELEKRAIHLLLEEGKELYKMKALNVLGRTSNEVANLPAFIFPFGGATLNNKI